MIKIKENETDIVVEVEVDDQNYPRKFTFTDGNGLTGADLAAILYYTNADVAYDCKRGDK